jgi:hypothetical protein
VVGVVNFPTGATIAINDTIPLFNIGAGSAAHIIAYWLDSSALDAGASLTLTMRDSNTAPTTFFTANATLRAGAILTHATAAHGTFGSAIVYQASSLIYLIAAAGGTGALAAPQTLYFGFELARD